MATPNPMRPVQRRRGLTRFADRPAVLRKTRWWTMWLLMVLLAPGHTAPAADPEMLLPIGTDAVITPVPQPPPAAPLKLALGQRLFSDRRLSHNDTVACSSCHDVHTYGADDSHRKIARGGSTEALTTLSVFNAALSFRLDWQGNVRTLESQAQSALEDPGNMASSIDEVVRKLGADPRIVREFRAAYGRPPDRSSLLDAIATYERSLVTPGSRFDLWLKGDKTALSPEEQQGYALFQSRGCISCHQGVNIGANLFERQGIFCSSVADSGRGGAACVQLNRNDVQQADASSNMLCYPACRRPHELRSIANRLPIRPPSTTDEIRNSLFIPDHSSHNRHAEPKQLAWH